MTISQKTIDFNKITVLWATNCIMPGVISKSVESMIWRYLIELVKELNNINIILKPHPADNSNWYRYEYEKYGAPDNITIVNKEDSIHYHICNADIVIAKLSTTGFEAMILNKPVISLLLNNKDFWIKLYREGAENFFDLDSFKHFMIELLSSKKRFESWQKERLEIQQNFLDRKIAKIHIPYNDYIVKIITEEIKKSRSV
jgi:CDP-glycerol glycerophosphotransferase (TagB/SpsB family)